MRVVTHCPHGYRSSWRAHRALPQDVSIDPARPPMSLNFLDFERPIRRPGGEDRRAAPCPQRLRRQHRRRDRQASLEERGADALDLQQADPLADRAPRAPPRNGRTPSITWIGSLLNSPSCTAIGTSPRTGPSSAAWRGSMGVPSWSSDIRRARHDQGEHRSELRDAASRGVTARRFGCSSWPSGFACRSSPSSTPPAPIRASAPKNADRPRRSPRNLHVMSTLGVPILCTVIGEGGSGGALAIGVADCVMMPPLQHLLRDLSGGLRLDPVEERGTGGGRGAGDGHHFGSAPRAGGSSTGSSGNPSAARIGIPPRRPHRSRPRSSRNWKTLAPMDLESLKRRRYERLMSYGRFKE